MPALEWLAPSSWLAMRSELRLESESLESDTAPGALITWIFLLPVSFQFFVALGVERHWNCVFVHLNGLWFESPHRSACPLHLLSDDRWNLLGSLDDLPILILQSLLLAPNCVRGGELTNSGSFPTG